MVISFPLFPTLVSSGLCFSGLYFSGLSTGRHAYDTFSTSTVLSSLQHPSTIMAFKEPNRTEFQQLVRWIFRFQRAHYHLWNLQRSPGVYNIPARIQRTGHRMEHCLIPSEPNSATTQLWRGNVANWTHTSNLILEEHYQHTIASLVETIPSLPDAEWDRAWVIGTKWAKNRFRSLQDATIHWVAQEVASIRGGRVLQVRTDLSDPGPGPQDIKGKLVSDRKRGISPGHDPVGAPIGEKRAKLLEQALASATDSISNCLTPSSSHHPTSSSQLVDNPLTIAPCPDFPPTVDPKMMAMAPKPQRIPRVFIPLSGKASPGECSVPSRPSTFPSSQKPGPSGTRPLEDSAYQRHEHLGDKKKNWSLIPRRPFLILGSSNLARLPRIYHSEVQVDCYPGANLSTITHLLKYKTPCSPLVREVILSVGLNDRNQPRSAVLSALLDGMLEVAGDTFPNARIRIPLINVSDLLPLPIITNICRLNNQIRFSHRAIPQLPSEHFRTEGDLIHWTRETGISMWGHWKRYLPL